MTKNTFFVVEIRKRKRRKKFKTTKDKCICLIFFVMINFILLVGISIIIYGKIIIAQQIESCEICIIDSTCADDTIYFNISISNYCRNPLNVYFTCYTDLNPKLHYYNTTTTCTNCYTNILIDVVRNAWDYVLTIESPRPSKICPTQHIAHCGGKMSQLILFITGGLSGLSIVLGVLLCYIKHCRGLKNQVEVKKKKVEVSSINAEIN
jgi:hypothetical protein